MSETTKEMFLFPKTQMRCLFFVMSDKQSKTILNKKDSELVLNKVITNDNSMSLNFLLINNSINQLIKQQLLFWQS